MTPEFRISIATGIALAVVTLTSVHTLLDNQNADIKALDDRLRDVEHGLTDLRERSAKLEPQLEGLREAITRPHAA